MYAGYETRLSLLGTERYKYTAPRLCVVGPLCRQGVSKKSLEWNREYNISEVRHRLEIEVEVNLPRIVFHLQIVQTRMKFLQEGHGIDTLIGQRQRQRYAEVQVVEEP